MESDSFVELKLTPRGKYYWSIKVGFQSKKFVQEELAQTVQRLDALLRDKFPNNSAAFTAKTSFRPVNEFEEDY